MRNATNVIKYILCFFLATIVIVSFYTLMSVKVFKKDYVNLFGYTYFVIASGSMAPAIDVNDIIVVKLNDEYNTNDVVTYRDEGTFITHRVTNVYTDTITTKGDANNTEDKIVKKEDVIGKVAFIVSAGAIIRIFGVVLLIVLMVVLVNFDNVFKKYIVRDKRKEVDSPLDYTCVIPIVKGDQIITNEILEKTKALGSIKAGKNNLDLKLNKKVVDKKEDENKKQKDKLKNILSYLSLNSKKPKITKKGAVKLQYLYKLANTVLLNPAHTEEIIDNVPFEELYDYDFEEIGFKKNIRDDLYTMSIYTYFIILIYAVIYDNNEYFDAVYKILKYRVKLDMDGAFLKDKHKVDKCIKLIEKVIDASGKKDTFELEKIVDIVKLNKNFN